MVCFSVRQDQKRFWLKSPDAGNDRVSDLFGVEPDFEGKNQEFWVPVMWIAPGVQMHLEFDGCGAPRRVVEPSRTCVLLQVSRLGFGGGSLETYFLGFFSGWARIVLGHVRFQGTKDIFHCVKHLVTYVGTHVRTCVFSFE